MLARTAPADPLRCVVEGRARDLERTTYRRLAGAPVERRHDLIDGFGVDRGWAPSPPPRAAPPPPVPHSPAPGSGTAPPSPSGHPGMQTRCESERPRRLSFQTTSTCLQAGAVSHSAALSPRLSYRRAMSQVSCVLALLDRMGA